MTSLSAPWKASTVETLTWEEAEEPLLSGGRRPLSWRRKGGREGARGE